MPVGLVAIIPPEPPTETGATTRFQPIAIDRISNERGHGTGGRIAAELRREGHELAPGIRDNGIGIATEMLERIFFRSVRVERRVVRSQRGVGIGLTRARKLAGLHGGTVAA